MSELQISNNLGIVPRMPVPSFGDAPEIVEKLEHTAWVGTLYCGGLVASAWNNQFGGSLFVEGQGLSIHEMNRHGESNIFWGEARRHKMSEIPHMHALQFEITGPGINGNPLKAERPTSRALRLYDFSTQKWCSHDLLMQVASDVGMPVADIVYRSPPGSFFDAQELRSLATGEYKGNPIKGVVFQPIDGDWAFKVLSLEYKD